MKGLKAKRMQKIRNIRPSPRRAQREGPSPFQRSEHSNSQKLFLRKFSLSSFFLFPSFVLYPPPVLISLSQCKALMPMRD